MKVSYVGLVHTTRTKSDLFRFAIFAFETRMHSSRTRTVRCSGHFSSHGRTPAAVAISPAMDARPLPCMPPLPCTPSAMHASLPCTPPATHAPHPPSCMPSTTHTTAMHTPCCAWPPAMHAPCLTCSPRRAPLPSVDRIIDTRLWKHYLSATTVADGKNVLQNIHLQNSLYYLFMNYNIYKCPPVPIGSTSALSQKPQIWLGCLRLTHFFQPDRSISCFTDHAQLFAQLIARTAKDIDVLIDSLPSEESSPELQVQNLLSKTSCLPSLLLAVTSDHNQIVRHFEILHLAQKSWNNRWPFKGGFMYNEKYYQETSHCDAKNNRHYVYPV